MRCAGGLGDHMARQKRQRSIALWVDKQGGEEDARNGKLPANTNHKKKDTIDIRNYI